MQANRENFKSTFLEAKNVCRETTGQPARKRKTFCWNIKTGEEFKKKICFFIKWQMSGKEEDWVIYQRQNTVVKQLVAEAEKESSN